MSVVASGEISGAGAGDVAGVTVGSLSSPNVISENVGTIFIAKLPGMLSDALSNEVSSKSKSVGNGNSPAGAGAASVGAGVGVARVGTGVAGTDSGMFVVVDIWGVLNAVVGACKACDRARINAPCSSVGRCDGISYVSGLSFSGVGFSAVFCAGGGAYNLRMRSGILNENRGLPVRAITLVVATYNGRADNISMPNVKPANPRRCA